MNISSTSINTKRTNLEILQKFQEFNPTAESFGNLCSECNNYFTVPVDIALFDSEIDNVSLSTHCQYCYAVHLTRNTFQQYLITSSNTASSEELKPLANSDSTMEVKEMEVAASVGNVLNDPADDLDSNADDPRSEMIHQWIYWRHGPTPENINVDERVQVEAEGIIDKLLESEYLAERFPKYPTYVQYFLFRQLREESPIRDIESFAALWKRTSSVHPEISWSSSLIQQVIHLENGPSDEFRDVAEIYSRKYSSSARRNREGNPPSGGLQIPAALFLLYDESVLLEVMKRANEQDEHIASSMLIELVDRWDELKIYPLNWALKMLDYSFLTKWMNEE